MNNDDIVICDLSRRQQKSQMEMMCPDHLPDVLTDQMTGVGNKNAPVHGSVAREPNTAQQHNTRTTTSL